MTTKNLLVELFVEELPPKALKKLGDAFAEGVFAYLKKDGFLSDSSASNAFASPRRLAVHITAVKVESDGKAYRQKWMPTSVAFDKQGDPSPALTKRLQKEYSSEIDVQSILKTDFEKSADEKGIETLFQNINVAGRSIARGLQEGLQEAIAKLPIPKVMSYQLESGCELPGWSSVSFVRPAHSLLALHGSEIVGVRALGLHAGNSTQGHRFEATKSPVVIVDADAYAQTLETDGAVIASFEARKADIAKQLAAAAAKVGGGSKPIEDDALLDEVTALVERPNVLVCEFEKQFLDVPQECLILTMKANQKYFPLLDAGGKLTNKFLVVSNIRPSDASAVVQGNERVVRPRLADAKFFFDQDRKKTLESRVAGLDKVVYHNKLGTQGERVERVRAIARAIGQQLGGDVLAKQADTAARLAKTDLLTDMVGEFPELQGIMGGYYARHDGLTEDIAFAIEDHYKPRFAGDALPRNQVGVVVALADKLETLVGMFGIGNLPTGDKDPFALRRHALGVIRMLVEQAPKLELPTLVASATPSFGALIQDPANALIDFIYDRFAGSLREQGYSAQEVDAVLSLRPPKLAEVAQRLAAVRAFASLPEAPALAAANKRVSNILKKVEGGAQAQVNDAALVEEAEKSLANALKTVAASADFAWAKGDYTANLQTLAALKEPVDEFFDQVMVNHEDPAIRANRLGLLATLHAAMNRVADLSKLAA
jgi:glycyl-tRNA synthetase beta chain